MFNSNSIGTNAVFKFCLDNKIKLIYSATSAVLGNKGNDKNLISLCILQNQKI
jgi:UDP-glucose 4-epimerase